METPEETRCEAEVIVTIADRTPEVLRCANDFRHAYAPCSWADADGTGHVALEDRGHRFVFYVETKSA